MRAVYRVVSSFFVAGFVVDGSGRVAECAPILRKYIAGRSVDEAMAELKRKGWDVERLEDLK